MASVFISHSSRDRRFVEQELTPLLARHGIQPWYSREEIKTAEEWEQRIFVDWRSATGSCRPITPRSRVGLGT